MAIEVRRNGVWVDNTQEKKRVNGAWVSNSPYKVMKPTISGVPPFTFKSDGENLRDWSMSGQTVQASIPSPSSPVDASGVGERTGNLFEGDLAQFDSQGGSGTTYQYFKISGNFTITFTAKNNCTSPQNTFLGITGNGGNASGGYSWGVEQGRIYSKDDVVTLKSSDNGYQFVSFYRGSENFEWILANFTIMLNTGSTAQPYEPYGWCVPVTCGGQTTNIYLGSATSTRRIKKLVLTGSESERWSYVPSGGISRFRIELADTAAVTELKSTHYVYELANAYGNAFVNTTLTALTICHSSANIYAFKDFLAEQYANGTPVTVWYVLAEPETAVVNEPLMKIGSYADEISKTSTGVDIPTVNGSNTLSVGTTVQPSEMSIESISQWV